MKQDFNTSPLVCVFCSGGFESVSECYVVYGDCFRVFWSVWGLFQSVLVFLGRVSECYGVCGECFRVLICLGSVLECFGVFRECFRVLQSVFG